MIRFVVLLGLIALTVMVSPAGAATLRPSATVTGSVIRLGDLFSDAGARADDAVAPSPPPGSRTIFDGAWLANAAREHGLDWQPRSRFDQAAVERATRIIDADAIRARLLAAISERQPVENGDIQLDNPGLQFAVAAEASAPVAVENLAIDARSGRFSAVLAGDDTGDAARQPVSGRLIQMASLPVLRHAIAPGVVIASGDIEELRLRAERVGPDMAVDRRELVGKAPRRALRAHEPVRLGDIQTPILVHKGDLVSIVLETAALRLTAQGKALEDAAQGASIRVANTKSNRVIDAKVVSANSVTVAMPARLAAREE
jgi:flagella basal body P-ring formation protein FlgA